MKINSLYDLDELILACRDEQAREYIREAVACYKSGAFRACIVATWIAVVFDYVHKLRLLDLTGDAEARQQLERLEKIRSGGDEALSEALDFERKVLDTAADKFELLTPLEKADLTRLQEDRHRCAHPSMHSLDEPYEPAPELARAHLRNAVEILLQREPVQGKAALDRIWADIASEYFPDTPQKAKDHFATGPLCRAKRSLIRGVIVGLTKDLMFEQRGDDERDRQFSALGGLLLLHSEAGEEVLRQDLSKILGEVKDEHLPQAVEYLWRVTPAWAIAGSAFQGRARHVVEKVDLDDGDEKPKLLRLLHSAMQVPDLKTITEGRLGSVSPEGLRQLLLWKRCPAYVEAVVEGIETTARYEYLRDIRKGALKLAMQEISSEQYRRLVQALSASDTVKRYTGWRGMVHEVWESKTCPAVDAATEWHAVHDRLCEARFKHFAQMRENLQATFQDLHEPAWPETVADTVTRSGDEGEDDVGDCDDISF